MVTNGHGGYEVSKSVDSYIIDLNKDSCTCRN